MPNIPNLSGGIKDLKELQLLEDDDQSSMGLDNLRNVKVCVPPSSLSLFPLPLEPTLEKFLSCCNLWGGFTGQGRRG
jgi:hypothetical protein